MGDYESRVKINVDDSDLSKVEKRIDGLNNKSVNVGVNANGVQNTSKQLDNLTQSTKTVNTEVTKTGGTLKSAFASMVIYRGIQKIISGMKEMINTVKQYNESIVDLQMATNQSYVKTFQLMKTYNQMGKQLGATGTEVAQAASNYLRQGKSIAETNQLIKDSMVLSKVSNIDSSDATEYLTAIRLGYEKTVDEMSAVNDALTSIDLSAAVDVAGLAEATSRTAAVASNAGIELNKLLGMEAAVGEASQESMSVIGTSFKTILNRMADIKSGKLELIDEDGTVETLSDVETVLKNMGIPLRDSSNEFRNFGTVLDEIASKWDSLSTVQSAAVSKAFAGQRQANRFQLLMENYDKALKYEEIANNSEGTALSKFDNYLASLESKSKSLQAAVESLATSTFSTNVIGGILDISKSVVELTEKFGLLRGAIAFTVTKGLMSFTSFIKNKWSKIVGFMTSPSTMISAGIGAVVALYGAIQRYKQSLIETATEATSAWESTKTSLQDYASQYQELKEKLDSGNLSEAETLDVKHQILDIQSQITEQYGNQVSGIDLVNGKLETQLGIIQNISQEEAQRNLNENRAAYNDAKSEMHRKRNYNLGELAIDTTDEDYNKARKDIEEIAKEFESQGISIENTDLGISVSFTGDVESANKVINDFESRVRKLTKIYGDDNTAIEAVLTNSSDSLAKSTEVLDKYQANYRAFLEQSLYAQGDGAELSKYSQAIEDFNEALLGGDTKAIDEARIALNEATNAKEAFLATKGNEQYQVMFDDLSEQIDSATQKYLDFTDIISGSQRSGNTFADEAEKIKFYVDHIKTLGLDSADILGAMTTDGFQNGERFINGLAEIYDVDFSDAGSIQSFVDVLEDAGVAAETTSENISDVADGISILTESAQNTVSGLNSIKDVLSSQVNGESISLDTFSSDELEDYRSALEYVNGTMQLNAEKANAIAEAKAEEAIATNEANKALRQADYLKNASEIENLRKELKGLEEGTTEYNDTKSRMDSLLADNSAIASECRQYDLLSSSIREAISEYQKWQAVNSGSDYGDMFDGTMEAYQRIMDTYDSDSDIYGDFGSKKFDAAVDLIVPDSVNTEDTEAISKYMSDFKQYLKIDSDGNVDGMNIGQFCKNAAEAGLMALDESGENYVLAGQVTMEDFAEGLNLSLPMVQAFFDELQLKGAEFDWADEAVKSVGDLGIKAYESAEAIRALGGHDNFEVQMDVSSIEDTDAKIKTLDTTISQMERFKIGADATEIEYANDIIQYCVAQKQVLSEPIIMSVDVSQLDGEIANVISKLQELQELQNQYEILASIDADTTNVEAEMAAVAEELKTIAPDITAKLNVDTTSKESILASIASITPEMLVNVGVKEDAIIGYTPENKTATVTYELDSTRVDAYNPKDLKRYVRYYVLTYGDNMLNGTAQASGTAYAHGTLGDTSWVTSRWQTKKDEIALTGETKPEMVVDPKTNTWWTVGDNGAEFANIPKGAIVFNGNQTEQLLTKGHINSRGKAHASGTAYIGGTIPISIIEEYSSYNTSSAKSNKSKSKSISSSSNSDGEEFNWIEVALSRIQRLITNVGKTVSATYKSWSERNNAISKEVSLITDEIELQKNAYEKYMELAAGVGLDSKYVKLVQTGAIDYETISDEKLAEKIKKYQEFFENALDCQDAIEELNNELADLSSNRFDNLIIKYDDELSLIEHEINILEGTINNIEKQGYIVSASYYEQLVEQENLLLSELNEELSVLNEELNEAVKSGTVEEFSEQWFNMKSEIMSVEEAILDSNSALIEYNNLVRELDWNIFDKAQELPLNLRKENDFLMELMSRDESFDEIGNMTDNGQALLGLHTINYNSYMKQVKDYEKEILKLNEELANDPNNQILLERRDELLESQRNLILSAEDEKEAMKELVSEGYDTLLDYMNQLINKRKETLNATKNLYDYEKSIKEQTKEITSLEKQLKAYEGDDSEASRATIQKIKVKLEEARENLEETERDRYIQEQEKLLDDLYSQTEEWINERLDNENVLLKSIEEAINNNAQMIKATLIGETNTVGTTISNELENALEDRVLLLNNDFKETIGSETRYSNNNDRLFGAAVSFDDELSVLPKSIGRNVISSVRVVEPLISLEQANKLRESFITDSPIMKNNSFDLPRYETTVNSNYSVQIGDIILEKVNNPDEFAQQLKNELLNNTSIRNIIQSDTLGIMTGHNSLSRYRH